MSVFQRLAQYFQCLALEFWQLVCKEHTIVSQRNLAGLRIGAATDKGRLADGVVRTAKGAGGNERAVAHAIGANWRNLKLACYTMYLCGLKTLL